MLRKDYGLKVNDILEVQAQSKVTKFERQQQPEANRKCTEISGERDKIESQLFKNG